MVVVNLLKSEVEVISSGKNEVIVEKRTGKGLRITRLEREGRFSPSLLLLSAPIRERITKLVKPKSTPVNSMM